MLLLMGSERSWTRERILSGLARDGYQPGRSWFRAIDLAKKMGLMEDSVDRGLQLTQRGKVCRDLANFRPAVCADIMHYILYTTWQPGGMRDYWSWSYRQICEAIWRARPRLDEPKVVFAQVQAEAEHQFEDLAPALGEETVLAVRNWLADLSPQFLIAAGGKFVSCAERQWFSPELAILALSYLANASNIAAGTPLPLQPMTMERLEPLCLAPAESIASIVQTASSTYPQLAIHTGEWGSSAILRQPVDIVSLFADRGV